MKAIFWASAALSTVLAWNSVAFAQEPGPAAPAAYESQDIVVTARRREEQLQDVPLSVVALSANALQEAQVQSASDLARVAPGLSMTAGSGNPTIVDFSIRGRGLNFGASAGSVETYFADVPLSSPFQMPKLPAQFFDLSSVQVLKGPQGTLFGRSTTGGAVLIAPQTPGDEFEGYARVGIGDYNARQFEGAVTVPLIEDVLSLRLAGFRSQRDGYVTQSPVDQSGNVIFNKHTGLPIGSFDMLNIDVTELRGILRFTPNEVFQNDLLLTFHTDKSYGGSAPGLVRTFNPANPQETVPAPGAGGYVSYNSVSSIRPSNYSYALINTSTLELTDNLTLKNIFGYIRAEGRVLAGQDSDGTSNAIIDIYVSPDRNLNEQFTEELQLQGTAFGDRLDYTIGALADITREPQDLNDLNHSSLSSLTNTTPAAYRTRFSSTNQDSFAIYGAGTFEITDPLSVSFGYRHTWDEVNATVASTFHSSVYAAPVQDDADPSTPDLDPTRKLSVDFESNVYNLGLEYHVSDDVMLYGGYRHGFKRGGFNSSAIAPSPVFFDDEQIDSYNLGAKTEFSLGPVNGRLNVELFHDIYEGFQGSYLAFQSGSLITITTNIPEVEYEGVDVDLALELGEHVDLNLTYTRVESEITDFPDFTNPGGPPLTANKIPFAPEDQFVGAIRFHGDLPNNLGEWVIRPSVNYQSEFYTTLFNTASPVGQTALFENIFILQGIGAGFGEYNHLANGAATVEERTLVDLRLEWNNIAGSNVDFALSATNLTDEYYTLGNGGTANFGAQADALGPPRMVLGELSVHF